MLNTSRFSGGEIKEVFKKMKIRLSIFGKLISGFLFVLLLLSIIAVIAIVQVDKADWSYSNLLERRNLVIENVQKLISEAITQENAIRGLIITEDETNRKDYDISREAFDHSLKEFEATAPNEEAKEQIEELVQSYNDYLQILENVLMSYDSNKDKAIEILKSNELKQAREVFHELAEGILHVANGVMAEDQLAAHSTVSFVKRMLIAATVFSIVLGCVISLFISRSISRSIQRVSFAMGELARGNFSIDLIKANNKDEIGDLVHSMNQMTQHLRNTLEQVSTSSEQIETLTGEIALSSEQSTSAADQLAAISEKSATGAENQLQSFKESAAKVNGITDQVTNIAKLSENVLEGSLSAREVTTKGTDYVNKIDEHMNNIHVTTVETANIIRSLEKHSEQISSIIALINSLSEQTNLLALNAAIEAARAGEYGQGFAVVAEEVRVLAEESHESADRVIETVQVIQEEIKKAVSAMENENKLVQEGLEQTKQTKRAFADIESSIESVTDQVQTVAKSVNEIDQYITEVATEIEQVRHISENSLNYAQEGSAASEEQLANSQEIAATIQRLVKITEEMRKRISRFTF